MPRVADISRDGLEIMTSLYNLDLIHHQMREFKWTPEILARKARISVPTANVALVGQLGTLKKLRRVTDALKIKWQFITNTDLVKDDFHQAVLTNVGRTGRSVKPRPVPGSANRPRSKELVT